MRAIWSDSSYSGKYVSFDGVKANPKPVKRGDLPIIMAGHTAAAFRRAVTTAQGWYGFGLDPASAEACIDGLSKAARRYERPANFEPLEISITPKGALDGSSVSAYEKMGVHRLIPLTGNRNDTASIVALVDETAKRYVH